MNKIENGKGGLKMIKNKKLMMMLAVFVLGATLLTGSVMGQTGSEQTTTAIASGTLKAVDVNAAKVTIAIANADDLVLSLTAESKIQLNGTPSDLTGLAAKINSNVDAEYQVTTKTVTIISIK